MTKFASLKKIHTKIIIVKRNLELNDLGFLYYSAKVCPMKIEQNTLFSKFFCYISWFAISSDQRQHQTTCERGLYVQSYCFFKKIAKWFKNYKLISDRLIFQSLYHTSLILAKWEIHETVKSCCNGRHYLNIALGKLMWLQEGSDKQND